MFKFNRKAFLQLSGQGTAVLSIKSARDALSSDGSVSTVTKETETELAVIGAGPGDLK